MSNDNTDQTNTTSSNIDTLGEFRSGQFSNLSRSGHYDISLGLTVGGTIGVELVRNQNVELSFEYHVITGPVDINITTQEIGFSIPVARNAIGSIDYDVTYSRGALVGTGWTISAGLPRGLDVHVSINVPTGQATSNMPAWGTAEEVIKTDIIFGVAITTVTTIERRVGMFQGNWRFETKQTNAFGETIPGTLNHVPVDPETQMRISSGLFFKDAVTNQKGNYIRE